MFSSDIDAIPFSTGMPLWDEELAFITDEWMTVQCSHASCKSLEQFCRQFLVNSVFLFATRQCFLQITPAGLALVWLGYVIPEDDSLWVISWALLLSILVFVSFCFLLCKALCPSSCSYYYVHQMERGIAWLGEWIFSGSLLMYLLRSVYGIVGKFASKKIHAHTFYFDCAVLVLMSECFRCGPYSPIPVTPAT